MAAATLSADKTSERAPLQDEDNSPHTGDMRPRMDHATSVLSPLPLNSLISNPPRRTCAGRPRESSVYLGSVYSSATLFDLTLCVEDEGSSPTRWYLIRLVCRLRPSVSWTVRRRFAHFVGLSRVLTASCPGMEIPTLPSKLTLRTAAKQQRRVTGLQWFCEQCLSDPKLLAEPSVGKFFDLDFGLWSQAAVERSSCRSALPGVDQAMLHASVLIQTVARGQVCRRWHTDSAKSAACA